MQVKTKPELMQSMKHYQKLAADRLSEIDSIKCSLDVYRDIKADLEGQIECITLDLIDAQTELFRLSKVGAEDPLAKKGNPKYDVTIHGKYGTGSCIVDVYRIIDACRVTNPQLQHLSKKSLFSGLRGHKDTRQDLVDIRDSAQSALDMFDDKNKLHKKEK